jgi:predicted RNase H-like HicB family nuclease/predicted transcriptional regulator
MSTVVYVALVASRAPEGYQARFPDIPGCTAEGASLAELLNDARERLLACLEAIEGQGEAWPIASAIETFTSTPGVMAIPVDVAVDDPPIRVNVSLGERLVQRLDKAAEARGMTRSGFIAQAVRASLGESHRGGEFDEVGRRIQDELTALGRRINESMGPDSPFTRRMNEIDGVVYEGVRKAADSVSAAMARRREAAKPGGGSPNDPPTAA